VFTKGEAPKDASKDIIEFVEVILSSLSTFSSPYKRLPFIS
jgi:hypothetical protein